MVLGAALAACGAVALILRDADRVLVALAAGSFCQAVVLAALTTREKVSYHAAGTAGLAAAGGAIGGPSLGVLLGLLALLTAWSRCYLGRHTLRQVALGLATGPLVLIWLARP